VRTTGDSKLTIISDFDAQTAVERELVLRFASLLWAEILRDRRNEVGHACGEFQVRASMSGDGKRGVGHRPQAIARTGTKLLSEAGSNPSAGGGTSCGFGQQPKAWGGTQE
jgi:hypothetical protein